MHIFITYNVSPEPRARILCSHPVHSLITYRVSTEPRAASSWSGAIGRLLRSMSRGRPLRQCHFVAKHPVSGRLRSYSASLLFFLHAQFGSHPVSLPVSWTPPCIFRVSSVVRASSWHLPRQSDLVTHEDKCGKCERRRKWRKMRWRIQSISQECFSFFFSFCCFKRSKLFSANLIISLFLPSIMAIKGAIIFLLLPNTSFPSFFQMLLMFFY